MYTAIKLTKLPKFAPPDGKAAEWYRKATELGYRRAMFGLARRYEKGRGVEQDYAQAAERARTAAKDTNAGAKKMTQLTDFERGKVL